MSYQSGTASSWSNLQSIIETFLTGSPGYTLTSGILTKTGTPIHMEFSNSSAELSLEMGKDSSAGSLLFTHPVMTGSNAQIVAMISDYMLTTVVFPINYEFFYFSSPEETFRCVIEYNNERTQNIGFGAIKKAVNAFGGVYVDGSAAGEEVSQNPTNIDWEQSYAGSVDRMNASPLPFGNSRAYTGGTSYPSSTQLWLESGGIEWYLIGEIKASLLSGNYSRASWAYDQTLKVGLFNEPEATDSLQTYNGNNALVPIRLFGLKIDDNYQRLGDVADIRYTNIKHRNFGEIDDDGTDKWKHYPAFFKNADSVNGGTTHTGQIGFAVRYDGP